jgi:hypothetical protein
MRAIDLEDAAVSQDPLRFRGVDERAVQVDVAVQQVVLRILVGAVDALLGEEDRHLRSRESAHIGVEVDRTADLVLDRVERLAGGTDLLARDRNPADALGCPLDESVEVGLPGGADDHDVVRPVPGSHSHAAEVVLETPRGDLRRDHEVALWIDVPERMCRRQRNRALEISRCVLVHERPQCVMLQRMSPGPALAPGSIAIEVPQDLASIELLVRRELHLGSDSW